MKIKINKFVKKTITIFLILIIIIIVAGGVYWFFLKKPADQFKDWKTYRNKEVGIKFKYPSIYNTNIEEYIKGEEGISAGSKVSIYFYKGEDKENWDFALNFTTKDYSAFLDFDSVSENQKLEDCISDCIFPNPTYEISEALFGESQPYYSKFCKLFKIDGRVAVFTSGVQFGGYCMPELSSRIELMDWRGEESLYNHFSVNIILRDSNNEYEKNIEEICSSNPSFTIDNPCCFNDVRSEIIRQSKIIVNSWNLFQESSVSSLSDQDYEIIINLSQILSTFKFIR